MRIEKSRLSGKISLPPSKSHTMRSLIFASLAKGKSKIHNFLPSPDTTSMIQALSSLGVSIKVEKCIEVDGGLSHKTALIDVGNAGQVYRFVSALAALGDKRVEFVGDHSITSRRPIAPLLSGIGQLGGIAKQEKGKVVIQGPISAGKVELDGTFSQPVSALLMAASALEGETSIQVQNPGERPWIDLTLHWLKKMGIEVSHQNHMKFKIKGKKIESFETSIPADWSSAAFPIVAAIITNSCLQIEGLDFEGAQGDKIIASWLEEHLLGNLFVHPTEIRGGTIDVNTCIDALPILAVLGCFATSPLYLINAFPARKKESDRLHAMTKELRKMGGNILEYPDRLVVYPSQLHGATLHSHDDHRVAMALAVAGMNASGVTFIENASCIKKSFPNFIEAFQKIGAKIS